MVSANEARSCDVVPGTPSGEEMPGAVLGEPVTGPGHDGVGLGVGVVVGDGEAVGVGAGAGGAAGADTAVGLAAGADGAAAVVVVFVTVGVGCGELAELGVTLGDEDAATLALDFARFAARWLGTPCWVILPILLDLRLADTA